MQKLCIYQNYHLLGQLLFLFTPQGPSPTLFLFLHSLIAHTPPKSSGFSLLPKFSYTQQTNKQQRHPPVPAKKQFCPSDPKAGKRGECPLIRQERTVPLLFGIYGNRKREEEGTVTFEFGCFVREGTWA